MYVIFNRGPQGRLAIVANCVYLFKYCINKNKINKISEIPRLLQNYVDEGSGLSWFELFSRDADN